MTVERVEFASLLCSRLCHDLLSPVGALNNGIELLADESDPEMRKRCLELLEQSARTTADKLKYFRLAFGSAGGFGEAIPTADAHAAISGMIGESRKIELGWLVHDDALPKAVIRVMLNLALVAIDALVRGGRLDIGVERHGEDVEIVIRAEGARLAVDDSIIAALEGNLPEGDLAARTAPAWMTHVIAQARGGRVVSSRDGADAILLGATLKA